MKRLFYIFLSLVLFISTLSPISVAYTQADEPKLEPEVEIQQPMLEERIGITPASSVTVMDEAELVAEISAGTAVIALGADIYISGDNLSIPAGADIRLEGNFVLSRADNTQAGSFITVETGASLTIDGVQIEAPADVTELRGVWVEYDAVLILLDGSISGFITDIGAGGGVLVDGGNFEMHGGRISGNTSEIGGGMAAWGGSSAAESTFSMWGGEISGNTVSEFGGGVYLSHATFDMWDGSINNNTVATTGASAYGGGILLDADGFLTMHGGEFSGNSAPMGGGVATHGGQFIMYDGKITNNTAMLGGGIHDEFFSSFPYLSTIHGGEVSGNTAELGGGIYVEEGASFTVSDAEIRDNTASLDSGLYLAHGTANVAVFADSYVTPDGAAGTAGLGGGIYLADSAALNVTGLSFIINNTAQSGGGIYTADVADYNNLTAADYQNITTAPTVVFRGNSASAAYEPPINADVDYPNIRYASSSVWTAGAYWNPINNLDINYMDTQPLYLVRYFANGGTGAHTDIRIADTAYTVRSHTAAGISRMAYNFTGWNTEADGSGTSYAAGDAITITANVNLYAQWVFVPGSGNNGGGELPSRQAYLIGAGGYIHPNANITRAEVATIFFRLINDDMRAANWSQTNPYSDVRLENWFNNAVSTTTQLGVFRGRPDRTFAPNQAITRAELVVAVVRLMDAAGILDVEKDMFSDIYGHWANAYINAAAMQNWIRGPHGHGGAFYPDRPITRAETAAIINRIFDRLPESTADLLPDMLIWPDNASTDAWYYLYLQAASNSYTFEMKPGGVYERWIALIPVRDWAALERPDSMPTGF